MNTEEFSRLLLFQNYEEAEIVLQQGFDPNTLLEQDKPAMEWSSYADDYRMMYILWKYGGQPTTPWAEEIINKFEKGESYIEVEQFYSKERNDVGNIEDYRDLTHEFSVQKLEFQTGTIRLQEESLYKISIPVSKFVLDNSIVDTAIELDFVPLPEPLSAYIGKSVVFPVNPEEGYADGSVYVRSSHNPVDLIRLSFLNAEDGMLMVEASMKFDFEYEGIGFENEELVIRIALEID
ncbi:hypothetical protein [Chryseobacterium sp. KCF3-3]|uniref:hypothetical protein n=1 Tax=Chryseobacterium sp. KCF3-3 TaxID=3231511 RepID=UPI0038B2E7F0